MCMHTRDLHTLVPETSQTINHWQVFFRQVKETTNLQAHFFYKTFHID